jgi:hypothetical protein
LQQFREHWQFTLPVCFYTYGLDTVAESRQGMNTYWLYPGISLITAVYGVVVLALLLGGAFQGPVHITIIGGSLG